MNKQHLDILIENEASLSLTNEQIEWLNSFVDGTWKYENGIVNVKGDINLQNEQLITIPVQFGIVTGYFSCAINNLISLKGCPSDIGGHFHCYENKLTSLEYMPSEIEGYIYCDSNPFILNDKLFRDLARIDGLVKIDDDLLNQLRNDIPFQFGITDKNVIKQIWQSYMDILEGKNNG